MPFYYWPLYFQCIIKWSLSILASMQFGELKCRITSSHLGHSRHSLSLSFSPFVFLSACQWRQSDHSSHQAINVGLIEIQHLAFNLQSDAAAMRHYWDSFALSSHPSPWPSGPAAHLANLMCQESRTKPWLTPSSPACCPALRRANVTVRLSAHGGYKKVKM